jgi:hypothetical protein
LSAKDMVEAYLTAIVLMQMRYKERNWMGSFLKCL